VGPGEAIGQIANDLIHRHRFKRPVVMFAAGVNGSVLAGDYPKGRLPVSLRVFCERPVGKLMKNPITVFYIDARGRTARAVMNGKQCDLTIDD
jgi:hypothetical protein